MSARTSNVIQVGETEQIWIPDNPTTKPGIIYCHGLGSSSLDGEPTSIFGTIFYDWFRSLNRVGFPVACQDNGGINTMNNSTAQARILSTKTYCQAQGFFPSGKVHLLGVSAGGALAHTAAFNNPTLFRSLLTINPPVNLQQARVDNVNGVRAIIDAAWGVTYPAALPAGSNPVTMTPPVSVPQSLYYATNDTYTSVADFTALPMSGRKKSLGPVGHTSGALTIDEIIEWFINN